MPFGGKSKARLAQNRNPAKRETISLGSLRSSAVFNSGPFHCGTTCSARAAFFHVAAPRLFLKFLTGLPIKEEDATSMSADERAGGSMGVGPISQANGADLLALINQSDGLAAAPPPSATITALNTAVNEAKLNIEEMLNASDVQSVDNVIGNNLDVMA